MTGRICGTGSCVPSFVMDNNDIAKLVDTSDEWNPGENRSRETSYHQRRDDGIHGRPSWTTGT